MHGNTVAVNEALVLHWAAQAAHRDRVTFVGMNPGLVVTDIRNGIHGGGLIGGLMERALGLFTPSADQFAARMLDLLYAPELAKHSGSLWGQKGTAILPSKPFQLDPARAATIYADCEALLKRTTQL